MQGMITGNVFAPDGATPRGDPFYSAFLSATGRVLHDVFIYPDRTGISGEGGENTFLIEADASHADTLMRYIKRYKLRAKVTLRRVNPGEISVWQAWGEPATARLDQSSFPSGLSFKDPRAPPMGYRLLQAGDKTPELDLEQTTEDTYTVMRYLNGVAEGQDEILKEVAFPQESNMDFMGGIDYHKGCYVGQELTIRTKHRGVVRKRILPCVIYDKATGPPQTLEYSPQGITAATIPPDVNISRSDKRSRPMGKWLRGVGNIGLGVCRLENMAGIQLPGETAGAAFDPDDKFEVRWGGGEAGPSEVVGVKAFVPTWLKAGLDGISA